MSRTSLLTSLIQFDAPLAGIKAELSTFPWDSKPLVILRRQHLTSILRRFENRELDASAVEDWAEFIESRDDIAFEADSASLIKQAIHDLANPALTAPLGKIAPALLATFGLV